MARGPLACVPCVPGEAYQPHLLNCQPTPHPTAGTYTPLYALVLALCAPLFTLLSTALYPHHLSTSLFLMVWLLSALGLFVLLLAVPPAAASAVGALPGLAANGAAAVGPGANSLAAAAPGSPFGSSARLARLSPGAASSAGSNAIGGGLWARVRQACSWQLRRPRRNVLLAILASLQCMLWMSLAADELVALFQVGSPPCFTVVQCQSCDVSRRGQPCKAGVRCSKADARAAGNTPSGLAPATLPCTSYTALHPGCSPRPPTPAHPRPTPPHPPPIHTAPPPYRPTRRPSAAL